MPLWLPQTSLSPLRFQNGKITPLVQSLGSLSVSHTSLNMWVSHSTMLSPPDFNISAVIAQMPGAFLLLSFFRAALTSSGVTGSILQAVLRATALAANEMAGSAGRYRVAEGGEVLFPAFEAVCFSYYKVAIRIFHQGCRDAWAITGLAQQAKDTAHIVVIGRGL